MGIDVYTIIDVHCTLGGVYKFAESVISTEDDYSEATRLFFEHIGKEVPEGDFPESYSRPVGDELIITELVCGRKW